MRRTEIQDQYLMKIRKQVVICQLESKSTARPTITEFIKDHRVELMSGEAPEDDSAILELKSEARMITSTRKSFWDISSHSSPDSKYDGLLSKNNGTQKAWEQYKRLSNQNFHGEEDKPNSSIQPKRNFRVGDLSTLHSTLSKSMWYIRQGNRIFMRKGINLIPQSNSKEGLSICFALESSLGTSGPLSTLPG